MPTRELAQRLDSRFELLTGRRRRRRQRQQTLQAMMDWSWELLADQERTVLRRMAVFVGGSDLAGVEAVCGAGVALTDALSGLVAKSLVTTDRSDADLRYQLLETVRLYAQQKLIDAGEAEEIWGRHAAWFAQRQAAVPVLSLIHI